MLVMSGGGNKSIIEDITTVMGITATRTCRFPDINLPMHGRIWHTMDYDYKKEIFIICGGDTRVSTRCIKHTLGTDGMISVFSTSVIESEPLLYNVISMKEQRCFHPPM